MRPLLCFLFVPGSYPERFAKALDAGADAICLDLEASVGFADKQRARRAVLDFVASHKARAEAMGCRMIVRLNSMRNDEGAADRKALAAAEVLPHFLMPAHSHGPEDPALASAAVDGACRIIALIESIQGLRNAPAIAAMDEVRRLMFGGADLSTELRSGMDFQSLLGPRSQMVQAAAYEGKELIDFPWLHVGDLDGLAAETRAVRNLGFTGKAAIHPNQVPVIREQFRPTPAEVERAHRVIAASEAAGGGVVVVDEHMVDRPGVIASSRILALDALLNSPTPAEQTSSAVRYDPTPQKVSASG